MKTFIFITLSMLFISFLPAGCMFHQGVEHNSQGEDCAYVAHRTTKIKDPERTYVKIGFEYILYDKEKHKDVKEYYYNNTDKRMEDANWRSNGHPCILTDYATSFFFRFWFALFLLLYTPYLLYKIFRYGLSRK